MRRPPALAFAAALVLAAAPRAAALGVDIKDVRAGGHTVHATIDIRDVVPDRFRRIVDSGRPLHLRLQAELWEARPVWDRLVFPAMIRMFRLAHRPASRDVEIDDSAGATTSYSAVPNPLELILDLGSRDRIESTERYYVHVVATIGTLADRDVDEVGDAVFGREDDENALGSFGRLIFRTALKISDYLQSVSAEAKSRKLAGADIIRP